MLRAPEISLHKLISCLQNAYGLSAAEVAFLPLGADMNSAVYRVAGIEGTGYFLKLRSGDFDEMGVLVPHLLQAHGVVEVIPSLPTLDDQPWIRLDEYAVILYPFVEGQDGYEVELSDAQWVALGAAIRELHDLSLPPDLDGHMPRETYGGHWRNLVRHFMTTQLNSRYDDAVAAEMADFLRRKHEEVLRLADQVEALAGMLSAQPPQMVLCHADLHAGNVLISQGELFVVDWDTLLLAPRERDLMFPGGAQGFRGHMPAQEESLFYQGYGSTSVNQQALAYYRGERIIEDIAVECRQVFGQQAGDADRAQEFANVRNNFAPDGTLAAFYGTKWR